MKPILILAIILASPLAAQARRQPCMLTPETRQFDFWVGKWKVMATGTKVVVGHSTIAIASGGCAITEDWQGAKGEEGSSINFFDPHTQEWEQIYVGSGNSSGRIQRYVHGVLRDGAMRFESESINAQGNPVKIHFRFQNLGDRVRQVHETSSDGGATWTVDYDLTYTQDSGT